MPKMKLSAYFSETGLRWLWLALLMLVLDQITKYWVAFSFNYGESLNLIPFFNLTYVHNTGAAFSFLSDAGGWQRWLFAVIALAISGLLVNWMAKAPKQQILAPVAFALILGGAIGNLIDRLVLGYVIDFIDFYVGNWHWPAFNIADSAICVGAGLMLVEAFFGKPDQSQAGADQLGAKK